MWKPNKKIVYVVHMKKSWIIKYLKKQISVYKTNGEDYT
jgi:hypothetical protein